VEELLGLIEQRAALAEQLRAATVADPEVALKFLQPGRILRLSTGPPNARRALPQLGPVPKGAGLEEGIGGGYGAAAGEESSKSGSSEDMGKGAQGPSLEDILQLIDG
jgi:hypothetical protein